MWALNKEIKKESNVLHKSKIHVAMLQQTQFTDDINIEIRDYTLYPCDCKECYHKPQHDIVRSVVNIGTIQPTIIQK